MSEKKIRYSVPSKERARNLKQYAKMTDEEFDEAWSSKIVGFGATVLFNSRIDAKLDEFAIDYDVTDLKINDKLTLRALAQSFITLEDLEAFSFELRKDGIAETDLLKLEKLNNMMSIIRKDISLMQNDLKITRKIRKGEDEETVISFIDKLKNSAKEFYEKRMFYVWCDKCSMLLFTGWFLYPDDSRNKVQLVCNRKLDDGKLCNNKVQVRSKYLLEDRKSTRL